MFASDVDQQILAAAAALQAAQAAEAKQEGRAQSLLRRGLALLGTPYRWGGTSPEGGFDCSGLVGYVFRTALGIELPRVSRDMARDGQQVERTALVPGDLVFFGRRGKRVDHVGIYIGEGRFLHAPRTGRDVTVSELDTGYWSRKFLQARRVAGLGTES
ncbi:NlpC/P60 family protein [Luteimonas viscosa]|uniref:NlpC/P60 family protein n=2 Tax=Luteimonas viscosa TaxID=1132694 RepID=A0A5D4XWR2_9GAMM|nr:NlpC/P60 family protein [Luteimonas viscosa]